MVEGEEKLVPSMSALAILSCRPNSHPFQERHISLHETVKIGRSVARARPSGSNGIFDCKVLSRHHAMLCYENGKFYLQDTKSSNGTFINNQRLCKGGEESPAREIFSGDLIQFGVEVMESNRRGEKITHGCIIATISLYHPDGREAKPIPFLTGENQAGISLQTQDLYQLAQYLQEALHREKMLEQKLLALQQLVQNTQEASESGWQALIDEDKLLSRLEMLENQLHIYSKNHSEDTLRQQLAAVQEDKNKFETTSKESLCRVLQEKIEAVTKLSDLEQSLSNMKEECSHLKLVCEGSENELKLLAEKYQDQLKEVADLQDKLQEAELNHTVEVEKSNQEKSDISQRLEEMIQQEITLSAKIESLQADNDFTKEQLAAMKAKLESIKESNEDDQKLTQLSLNCTTGEAIDIIPLDPPKEDDVPENLEAKLKDLQKLIEVYKGKLEISDTKLQESTDKVQQLQKELDEAVSSSKAYLAQITILEDKVKYSDYKMNHVMETALDSLKSQLNESAKQSNSSNDLIEVMKDHINIIEKELTYQTPVNSVVNSTDSLSETLVCTDTPSPSIDSLSSDSPICSSPPRTTTLVNGESDLNNTIVISPDEENESSKKNNGVSSAFEKDDDFKALLEEAKSAQIRAEIELKKFKDEKTDSDQKLKETLDEVTSLKSQLANAKTQAKEKADEVSDLQEQVKKAASFTQEVKQQILDLRDELKVEKNKTNSAERELEDAKLQLATSQQNAKQNHNETEHLREYQALKEECTNLRKRIQAIEAEMKMSRKENLHLSSEYNKLQESYKHLESLKLKLETSESSWKVNLTDAQKDAQNIRQELLEANTELVRLRENCEEKSQQIGSLQKQISEMSSDFQSLHSKSRMVSLVSSIPLLLLLFAILMAIYPTLEAITSTFS